MVRISTGLVRGKSIEVRAGVSGASNGTNTRCTDDGRRPGLDPHLHRQAVLISQLRAWNSRGSVDNPGGAPQCRKRVIEVITLVAVAAETLQNGRSPAWPCAINESLPLRGSHQLALAMLHRPAAVPCRKRDLRMYLFDPTLDINLAPEQLVHFQDLWKDRERLSRERTTVYISVLGAGHLVVGLVHDGMYRRRTGSESVPGYAGGVVGTCSG